jgi:hypothetical protein
MDCDEPCRLGGHGGRAGTIAMASFGSLPRTLGLCASLFLLAGKSRGSDQDAIDKVFGTWVSSQGGMGSETFIDSYAIQERIEIKAASENKADAHILRTRSGHFRIELTGPTGSSIVFGYDGDIGWTARPDVGFSLEAIAPTDPMIWQNDLFVALDFVPFATPHHAMAPAVVDGVDCVVAGVEVAGGSQETCYFERKTMRPVRIEKPLAPIAGVPRKLTIDLGDYRAVGKLSVPHIIRVDNGTMVVIHRRSSVIINPVFDEGSFVLSTAQVAEANAVSQILSRQAATVGTPQAFNRIRTRVTSLSVMSPTTGVGSKQVVSQKAPNLVVVESHTPGMGWEARGFDGKEGWFSSEIEGNRPLTPTELGQLFYSTSINQTGQLAALCPYRRLLGERLVDGRKTEAVLLAPAIGPPATYYFDGESGRLVRIAATQAGSSGSAFEATLDFADFRVMDGVEVPFRRTYETPVMKSVSTVESVSNNVQLDDGIFRQRKDD